MTAKTVRMIKDELATLAYFESDAVEPQIVLEDRFENAESFRKSLWRPDLFIMTLIPHVIGGVLIWLELWIIAALIMLPGLALNVIFANDLVAYVLWSRSDGRKLRERYLWERNRSLQILRAKLVRAQRARIQDLVKGSISPSNLPVDVREAVEPILKQKFTDVDRDAVRTLLKDPDAES